jgi:hypothetical protein
MTDTKKKKNPSFVSPKGRFRFPHLIKPNYGTKDFPCPEGRYEVQLVMTAAEAMPLMEKLEATWQEALTIARAEFAKLAPAKRKQLKDITEQPYWQEEYDRDTEEPTGNLIFRFRTSASGTKKNGEKWERKIDLFDSKGRPCKPKEIRGGTVGKIAFTAAPYYVNANGMAGLTLYLDAVQILELADTARDAAGYGFSEEQGGFECAQPEPGDERFSEGADADDAGADENAHEDVDF